jgi:hypothetical protein
MANEEHLARLKEAIGKKDIAQWNEWRFGNQEVKPDLSELKSGTTFGV